MIRPGDLLQLCDGAACGLVKPSNPGGWVYLHHTVGERFVLVISASQFRPLVTVLVGNQLWVVQPYALRATGVRAVP